MIFQQGKKKFALYLTVAFFFALFSFGKTVYGAGEIYSQPGFGSLGAGNANGSSTPSFTSTLYAGTIDWKVNNYLNSASGVGGLVYGFSLTDITNGENFYCEGITNSGTNGTNINAQATAGLQTITWDCSYAIRSDLFTGSFIASSTPFLFKAGHNYQAGIGSEYGINFKVYGNGTNPYVIFNEFINPEITRIIEMQPENGSTTGNVVSFLVKVNINTEDANRGVGVKFFLHNIDQNVLFLSNLSPSDIILYDDYIDTPGIFTFSTTTILGDGNYRLLARLTGTSGDFFGNPVISGCSIVGNFINLVCTSASVQFIVNQDTFIGNISQNSFRQIGDIFSSSTATSTANLANTCNLLNISNFSIINCLAFLFIPDGGLVFDSLNDFKDKVITHFPLGYITDFVSIISTSSVGTLTPIDATIPSGVIGTGAHIRLDLTGSLDSLLNATTSGFISEGASSTETFFEITSHYWNIVLYTMAIFYIMSRVIGGYFNFKHRKK